MVGMFYCDAKDAPIQSPFTTHMYLHNIEWQCLGYSCLKLCNGICMRIINFVKILQTLIFLFV
jgi:hypothetical protein